VNIGLDLHGTIDTNPSFFANFIDKAQENGTFIYIVSGPPIKDIEKTLDELSIPIYTPFVLSIVDYLKEKGALMWKKKNGWWADDEVWWSSKAEICKEYKIKVLVDDKMEYAEYFTSTEKFILYNNNIVQALTLTNYDRSFK